MLSWDLSPDISVFPEATQLLGLRALEWHCVSVSPSWVLDRVNGVAGKNRIEKTISNLSMRIFYMEGPEDLNICLIATSLMDITPSLGTRSEKIMEHKSLPVFRTEYGGAQLFDPGIEIKRVS